MIASSRPCLAAERIVSSSTASASPVGAETFRVSREKSALVRPSSNAGLRTRRRARSAVEDRGQQLGNDQVAFGGHHRALLREVGDHSQKRYIIPDPQGGIGPPLQCEPCLAGRRGKRSARRRCGRSTWSCSTRARLRDERPATPLPGCVSAAATRAAAGGWAAPGQRVPEMPAGLQVHQGRGSSPRRPRRGNLVRNTWSGPPLRGSSRPPPLLRSPGRASRRPVNGPPLARTCCSSLPTTGRSRMPGCSGTRACARRRSIGSRAKASGSPTRSRPRPRALPRVVRS